MESIFFLNVVMNIYLFKLTSRILGKPTTFLKILGGSITGAILFCISILIRNMYKLPTIFIMILTSVLSCWIVFRPRHPKELLRQMGYLYTLSFLMGGTFLALEKNVPFFRNMRNSGLLLLLAGLAVFGCSSWGIRKIKKKRNCNSCVVHLDGDCEKIQVLALIDTGNGLREPISGKCVSILEECVWERMTRSMKPEKMRIIPYHSLGKERGMMEGYEVDKMEIHRGDSVSIHTGMILAVYKGTLSSHENYQMILPSELFT